MKIKILKATSPELEGITLKLEQITDMLYQCKNTGIEIVDTWDEISYLHKFAVESRCKIYFDLHLFQTTEKGLIFIEEIKFISL